MNNSLSPRSYSHNFERETDYQNSIALAYVPVYDFSRDSINKYLESYKIIITN